MTTTARTDTALVEAERPEIVRYSFFDRIVHWEVALTFVYLLLTGFAFAYPRMAWLATLLGGGQTSRTLHPWVGVAFTVGIVVMLVRWTADMRPEKTDREWLRRIGAYVRTGHSGVDVGRYNAGQKIYYWYSIVFGLVLLVSGIPLWYPWMLSSGWDQAARLVHHVAYLLMLAGFIIHVYMSTALLPGTLSGMTAGKVTRRWAAWHHPRWFRQQVGSPK